MFLGVIPGVYEPLETSSRTPGVPCPSDFIAMDFQITTFLISCQFPFTFFSG